MRKSYNQIPIIYLTFCGLLGITFSWLQPLRAQSSQELLKQATQIHFDFPDSALAINKYVESLARERNSLDTMAISRNKQAALHYMKSNYVQSLKDFSQAYEWAISANNQKEIAYSENGIGLVYLGQLQYNKAKSAFNKALKMNTDLADSSAMGRNLFNIGICERELNNYETSITYFNQALDILQKYPLNYLYVMVINQKAKSLYKLKRYNEALDLYNHALSFEELLNTWERAFAYTGIAEIQLDKGLYEEALTNSTLGFAYAEKLGAIWDKTRAINVMWRAEEATGRISNALMHAKTYILYKDSLYNREKDLQINSLQLELATLKNENLENNLKLAEKEKRFTFAIIIGSSIIIILLLFLVFYFLKTLKTVKELNGQLKEKNEDIKSQKVELLEMNKAKNQIFSIVSHDMRGPIRSVIQILDMEKAGDLTPEDKKELDEMLQKQLERTRNMMDEMLNWANNQLDGLKRVVKKVNLIDLVKEEEHKIEIALQAKKITFVFENHSKNPYAFIDANQLKVILQNLISNAVKFTHLYGEITIRIKENEGYKLIEICDNGVGMDEQTLSLVRKRDDKIPSKKGTQNEQGTGIGLLLTDQLIKANHIKLEVDSTLGKGSTFTLYLPNKNEN